ncbi:MAG: long-chain fatty acid--CoA ligase [Streptomycetaceae bacterium]|nr:long-chain fatty acid--CoA ligase [Streptomycetaceae bacterium]
MRNEGIGSWTARRARKTPDRIALVHEGAVSTYAELHDRTTRLAHALRGAGVRRGDRVAYLGPNHPSYLETLFATGMLGAVFVPLNTRLAAAEIAYQLTDCGAATLVYGPAHTGLVAELGAALPHRLFALPGTEPAPGARDFRDYEAEVAGAPDTSIDEPVRPDDPCLIMYTSGTTGRPKGAVLTHGNLTWNAVNVLVDHDLVADEVALVSAPLFHTAGLNMLTLPVLLKGGACVIAGRFDATATLDLIARHRITFMFGVPAMYAQVAREPAWKDADLSSLRILTCGGAPVPGTLIETYQERGLTFLQGYGMTEASPGVLFLDAAHAVAKAGSAGVPHYFSDVRVAGPDLTPTAPGETGEIVVRGPHVMAGYWGLPDETAAAFGDGWFHSGDAARIDADGYVYVVDRIKDMIISGGENIYPAEVEDALLAHPDVVECAVIGLPDERWGEVGRALVVLRDGASVADRDLLDALGARLAAYKIPKSVVRVDALPRNAAGKVLKAELRRRHGA